MTTNTEKLIELVRCVRVCRACLYDTSHPDYSKKTLKELLWVRIAKELNYKDGPSAKDSWNKLRNCHRDAIRRRNKLYRSGSAATVNKPWKFENQMEFLVTYMTNRPTTGNMSTGNPCHDQNLIQPEDLINYQEDEIELNETLQSEASSQILQPNIRRNNSNEHPVASIQLLTTDINDNNSTEDSVASSQLLRPSISQKNILHVAPRTVKESKAKKYDINTLIANTLKNHENRAQERAEKKSRDEVDEMQHFFNTMYAITKKMPALSQHRLKRQIFDLVSDEEEHLLHLELRSTRDTNSAGGSTSNSDPATTLLSTATPMPSSVDTPTDWFRVYSKQNN